VTGAAPAAAGLLYDARRGVYSKRPAFRGWLHLLFFASLAGGALLLARTHGAAQITAAAIYSASLGALFGTSALPSSPGNLRRSMPSTRDCAAVPARNC
jgi:hypothetical protein